MNNSKKPWVRFGRTLVNLEKVSYIDLDGTRLKLYNDTAASDDDYDNIVIFNFEDRDQALEYFEKLEYIIAPVDLLTYCGGYTGEE